jgi:hypothetical protein
VRIALLSILIAQLVMPASARVSDDPVWWVVHATSKIRPGDPVPREPRREAALQAAGNEFESFQIVLRSAAEVDDVDVTATSLTDGNGGEIAERFVQIYFVGTLSLTRPTRRSSETGDWPDPLIPRVDAYYHERRNAFPFSLSPLRNQAVWIEVYVPVDTKAGEYRGAVTVSVRGSEEFTVPIHLTVWNFPLPSTSSFTTTFGFNAFSAHKQHTGDYTSDYDVRHIAALYSKAALLHRISLHGGTFTPPTFKEDGQRMTLDWRHYDSEVGPFLDGTVFGANDPLPGARSTSIDLRTAGDAGTAAKKIQYWREWARHFREKGWFDRLFYYVKDEPAVADYVEVAKLASLAHQADPDLKTLVTVQRARELGGLVDIWTPLINCFERRTGFNDFCREIVPRNAYESDLHKGGKLWWYQSCGSHGCNIAGGPYFTGWPSYMIDDTPMSNRIMPWLAWKYRISGELYFNVNEAYNRPEDPWDSVYLFGGNGDGTLFYPGRTSKIGGTHDIPVESIRLKLIREGLEDYEYLTLLGRRAADTHVNRLAHGLYKFETDPEKLYAERAEMAEEIVTRAAGAKP